MRQDYSLALSAIISARCVLFQIVPQLTVLTIFASIIGPAPVFVFSKELNQLLPPLVVSKPFDEARRQEEDVFVGLNRKLTSRQAKKQARKHKKKMGQKVVKCKLQLANASDNDSPCVFSLCFYLEDATMEIYIVDDKFDDETNETKGKPSLPSTKTTTKENAESTRGEVLLARGKHMNYASSSFVDETSSNNEPQPFVAETFVLGSIIALQTKHLQQDKQSRFSGPLLEMRVLDVEVTALDTSDLVAPLWLVAIKGVYIYVTESRLFRFVLNLYRFTLAIGLLYSSPLAWMISTFFLILPYSLVRSFLFVMLLGKSLHIEDKDLYNAFTWRGFVHAVVALFPAPPKKEEVPQHPDADIEWQFDLASSEISFDEDEINTVALNLPPVPVIRHLGRL